MSMLSGALVIAMPLALAPDAGVVPVKDFDEVAISRADAAEEWPFSVDEGTLTCITYEGQRMVIFAEPWRDDVPQEFGNMTLPRSVLVSTNPFALLASLEDRALYAPFDSIETLIARLAPWETIGAAICDTPETEN
jgi:hypothetical protein